MIELTSLKMTLMLLATPPLESKVCGTLLLGRCANS